MTETDLRLAIETEPFTPVAIHTDDGTTYPITRPGQMAVTADRSAVAVDGLIRILLNRHITRVTPLHADMPR
jgi:hypothetical protein